MQENPSSGYGLEMSQSVCSVDNGSDSSSSGDSDSESESESSGPEGGVSPETFVSQHQGNKKYCFQLLIN